MDLEGQVEGGVERNRNVPVNSEGKPVYSRLIEEQMGQIQTLTIEGIPITKDFREANNLPESLSEYSFVSLKPKEDDLSLEKLNEKPSGSSFLAAVDKDAAKIRPRGAFLRGNSDAFLDMTLVLGMQRNEEQVLESLKRHDAKRLVIISAHGWTDTVSDGVRRDDNPSYEDLIKKYEAEGSAILFLACRNPELPPLKTNISPVIFQEGTVGIPENVQNKLPSTARVSEPPTPVAPSL